MSKIVFFLYEGTHLRFQALDSWRGIAALLVTCGHIRFLGHQYDWALVRGSWLCVDFFFVLSGFVIAHAYGKRLVEGYDSFSFAIRRFGRLWPLHIVVLIMFIMLEIVKWGLATGGLISPDTVAFDAGERFSLSSMFSNVFLLQSLGLHDELTWNMPSWSISTEFYTYLIFAKVCLITHRRARLVAVAAIAITGITVVALYAGETLNTTYDYGIFRCAYGFMTGVLCYEVFQRTRNTSYKPSTFVETIMFLVAFGFIAAAGTHPMSLAAPLVFAIVIWVFAHEHGRLSQFMLTKPFQRLGDWSYSVYMIHFLVWVVVSRLFAVFESARGESLRVDHYSTIGGFQIELISFGNVYWMDLLSILYLAVVIALSAGTYRYVEKPCRGYFNRIAQKRDDQKYQPVLAQ